MKTEKITAEELEKCKIGSLPTRPCAPAAYGGRGYSPREMKDAFDKLPTLVAERLNSLLDDIRSEGADSIITAIPSGIEKGHTLADLTKDISSGAFASYLDVYGKPLTALISEITADIASIKRMLSGEKDV